MASSVSSASVADQCHVVGDSSSSFGAEGVCMSPTEGTCMALIMFVCSVVVLVFAVCVLVFISVLKVGA